MDSDIRDAFDTIGRQVTDGLREVNGRLETYHREFLDFKRGVVGPTDPPAPPPSPLVTAEEVDEHAKVLLNGSHPAPPPSTLKARMTSGEEAQAKLRADVDRLLELQTQQSKEQGSGESFLTYLRSRSGRKLVLQVITAVLVLAGYVDGRMGHAPPSSTIQASPR